MKEEMMNYLVAGSPAHWVQICAVMAFLVFEKWLPNSQFKANSTLEIIGNMLKPMLGKVPMVKSVVNLMATPEPKTAIEPMDAE